MKIIIVRHADPDYEHDSITEKGKIEASLLADYLCKYYPQIDNVFCSTFGRAKATIAPYLNKSGKEALYLNWLIEFLTKAHRPDINEEWGLAWDILPEYVSSHPKLFSPTEWMKEELYAGTDVYPTFKEIGENLDLILAMNGYSREGNIYTTNEGNHKTLLFACHFGVECVLLAHLLNCSPVTFWLGSVALSSSITVLNTEERRKGIVSFRMETFGSIPHLRIANIEPSFAARFCECFEDKTRHD